MADPPGPAGLNDNHERALLAGCQYAAKLLSDSEAILTAAETPPTLARYRGGLAPIERRIARDYLRRLRQHLIRMLEVLGIAPPPARIDATQALRATVTALDITFEEMSARHLRGYGALPRAAADLLDGVVAEVRGIVRDLDRLLSRSPGETLRGRIAALEPDHPFASDLRTLERIVTEYGLVDLRPALEAIVDRTADQDLEVAIVGRVSSGKSSLLNRLLGAPVLPVGVLPVTSVPTRLRRGADPAVFVTFADGRVEAVSTDRIGEFVTEEHNPGNEKRLMRIVVEYPAAEVPDGVTFVDTPGLGSLLTAGALQTLTYLPRCDHGTLVVDASAPLGEEDLSVLELMRDAGITMSVLVSKADLLSPEDVASVTRHVRQVIATRIGVDVPVRPVSALPAHADLLTDWLIEEVRPLAGRARQRAAQILARKVQRLRERAASALKQRTRDQTAREAVRSDLRAFDDQMREVRARLDQTARDLEDLPSLSADVASRALTAASAALVSAIGQRRSPDEASALVRAAAFEAAHLPAERTATALAGLAGDVRQILHEAGEVAQLPRDAGSVGAVDRGVPPLDLPALPLRTTPPWWVSATPALLRHWADRHVREACGPTLMRAVEAHLHVVRGWAREALSQLRREFEAESRPLLALLSASALPAPPNLPAPSSVDDDLRWLTEEPVQS